MKAVSGLDPDGVMADLDAAADYGKHLPAANGKIAVVGFCWGGAKSFAFATHRKDLSAAFVFYGTGPEPTFPAITAPVYGFYGGNDARVGATVPGTTEAMKAAGKNTSRSPTMAQGTDSCAPAKIPATRFRATRRLANRDLRGW